MPPTVLLLPLVLGYVLPMSQIETLYFSVGAAAPWAVEHLEVPQLEEAAAAPALPSIEVIEAPPEVAACPADPAHQN